jgi:hypothetical protein
MKAGSPEYQQAVAGTGRDDQYDADHAEEVVWRAAVLVLLERIAVAVEAP